MNVKIVDSLFSHARYSTDFQESKHINWDRKPITPSDDAVVYTDASLHHVLPSVKNKVAWLLESKLITGNSYRWLLDNHDKFDHVITHDSELLSISDKFKFSPVGGCWIKPCDQTIYNKSKDVSIIASTKNMTDGHKLRHSVINNTAGIDIYGRGYNPIDYKLSALSDYRFSIVIENAKYDYYFTEKLIDCLVTGTVPVYWGCPSIGDFFDTRGIIIIDSLTDAKDVIGKLDSDKYDSMLPYVIANFELAKEFLIAEDYIHDNILSKF